MGGSRTQEFTRDVNYKMNGHDILVRVSGQFNPATGVVNWNFASLEANGNELDDVMNGFLLPNDQNGRGEGFVSFIIDHKPNPANGSTISNKATIVFDANEPIVTNTYTNTFDTDYPTSKVTKAEEPSEGKLTVTVSGIREQAHAYLTTHLSTLDDHVAPLNNVSDNAHYVALLPADTPTAIRQLRHDPQRQPQVHITRSDAGLLITGLPADGHLRVFNSAGILCFSREDVATTTILVPLRQHDTYLVSTGKEVVKVVF